ncbi:MAG TPA: DUF1016 N-terminal domain-containing protein [Bacteroidota bacterium]|nr:DUF1016 N-terminal domain-containing protein [Bacteroidota bacterium]
MSRHQSARTVNALLTATYWEIGRKIIEFEQRGLDRAKYGEKLLQSLASDLPAQFGRGFSVDNLGSSRNFRDTVSEITAKDNTHCFLQNRIPLKSR